MLPTLTDILVGGIGLADEDVGPYDAAIGIYFDGSDVGLETTDVNAFALLPDGSLAMSFDSATFELPGVGIVEDSDIVRFIPASLGENTAGSFQLLFDGSDVGLETDGEGIDALFVPPNRHLIISTTGGHEIGNLTGQDVDLIRFQPTSLGANTSGSWCLAFDGSDVDLHSHTSEDIWGAWVDVASHDV